MASPGNTIKSTSLDHALHNEKVCKHLDRHAEFADWVITTAFYSALHFVQHKMFPLQQEHDDGSVNEVTNFKSYYKRFNPKQLDRHKLLADLVDRHCSDIAAAYDQLKDLCWNARYHRFQYERRISNLAKDLLKEIKVFCHNVSTNDAEEASSTTRPGG